MKMKKIALILAVSLLISAAGCSKTEGEAVSVQAVTMAAQVNGLGTANRFGGMVVAQSEVGVQKDEGRTVKELKVTEGQEVTAGDVLFTYDVDEISVSLEKLELEKEQMENQIANTEAEISQLQREKASAPSSEQLAYSIQIQDQQISLTEAKYTLSAKEKEIERTKTTLTNAEVKAPVSGVVKSISDNSDSNSYYSDQSSAFITITETGDYKVKGSISELNVGEMGEGTAVIIRSRVDDTQVWHGTVEKIEWGSTESNNDQDVYYGAMMEGSSASSYPFYVVLDSADGLMLGQHVYIEPDFGQGESKEGIWLSSAYIVDAEGDAFVWAMGKKDKLEKRELTLGTYDVENDLYEIVSGLEITDYIAFPEEDLKEGMTTVKYDEIMFEEPANYEGEYNEYEEGSESESYFGGADEPVEEPIMEDAAVEVG